MDAQCAVVRKAPDTYTNGHNRRQELGLLISHPLLDKLLLRNPKQFMDSRVDEMLVRAPGALKTGQLIWTLELVVAPKPYDVFRRGVNIMDPLTGWTLPWSFMPEAAFEIPNLALRLVPELSGCGRGTVVRPKNSEPIILVENFIQDPMGRGAVDPVSRMATTGNAKTETELREFKRPSTEFIRPATRCADMPYFISFVEHPDMDKLWLIFIQLANKSGAKPSASPSESSKTPTSIIIQPDPSVDRLMGELNGILGRK